MRVCVSRSSSYRLTLFLLSLFFVSAIIFFAPNRAYAYEAKSIAVGSNHVCAVVTDSGVKCWGKNANGELGTGTNTDSNIPVDVVSLPADITQVSAGQGSSCAVTGGGVLSAGE